MDFSRLFRGKKSEPAAEPEPALETPSGAEPSSAAASAPSAPEGSAAAESAPPQVPANPERIREAAIEVLRTVYDPEIPVNIYEMGLVYDVDVDQAGHMMIRMTLTSPGCPVAGSLIPEIESRTARIEGVASSRVELVWDPPWDPNMMSDAAKLQLGIF